MASLIQFFRSSVRRRLVALVLAIAIPATVLVALLVWQTYRNERASVARQLSSVVRALGSIVDHQVAEKEWLLRGMVTARTLTTGDIATFERTARALDLRTGAWLVLLDAEGQQLMNTRAPAGQALPKQEIDGEFRATLESGKTYVSNLITGTLSEQPVLFVAMPVIREGKLRYVLAYVMKSDAFAEVLKVERFADGMVVSILDRTGTIAARRPNGDRYVGKKATPDILAAMRTSSGGMHRSTTLEGMDVLAAYSRAPVSGWTVAVGAPHAGLFAPAREVLIMGVGISAVLMAAAIFIALWTGRALVHGVDALVADANALGRGEMPRERPSGLQETDFVADAMRKSARWLEERERDNALLNEALQRELENQRRAEAASRSLAAIVESSEDAIVSKDLTGIITSWNAGAERIFGYPAAEIVGKSITLLIPQDRISEELSIITRIRKGERVEHFETMRRRKDGSLIPLSISVSPVRGADGKVIGASKIARDITQRKRIEAQQHALYDLVAAVNRAEALPEIYDAAIGAMLRCQQAERAAILLADAEGVMRFTSSRGLSEAYREQVEGHSPWSAAEEDYQPLWIDDVAKANLEPKLRQALQGEGIRALAFVPLKHQKRLIGKFMVYYNTPRTFTMAELRPVETIASQVAFAIERQRGAEALEALVDERTASLQLAVDQMEEFSYSVSHDLRAPTRAMCGYAEALLEEQGHKLDDGGRTMLQRILHNSHRMDRLIQDLLTYTRITRREVKLEPVSVEKLVYEVAQQYPDLHPEKSDIVVNGTLPDVLAHEPSLTQVVSNLLTNAVKFVAPGKRPRVVVGAERRGSRVRVWFHDNGIGILPDVQGKLFRMFERLHPEKNYEGTGIGLAIVRKAVERMHGTVGVESDGITGSRFWFELPLAGNADVARPEEAVADAAAGRV
ncbi:MAG: PAS domain S-box protein [Verrucomicrobiota bacterium]